MNEEIQNTVEYDINLNKELVIPVAGTYQQGEVSNVSVSSISPGAIQNAWKFGVNGSIEMYDEDGNLSILLAFE